MTSGTEDRPPREPARGSRKVIPASCTTHGGTPGFTNLAVSKRDGDIVLDPRATGACVIVMNETASTALFNFLGELLGRASRRSSGR